MFDEEPAVYTDADIEMREAAESADRLEAISRQVGTPFDRGNPVHLARLGEAARASVDSWGSVVQDTVEYLYDEYEIVGVISDDDFCNALFDAIEEARKQ